MEASDLESILIALQKTITAARDKKPQERSELARKYQIGITDLEKVYAWFYLLHVHEMNENKGA